MKHLMRITAALVLVLLMTAAAGGCGSDPEEDAVKQVLVDQLEYLRNEDIEGVMSTMHPESPQYAATRATMEQVFDLYQLDYELEEIDVVELDKNQAKVRAVQVTRKIEGPELADTRVTAIHTMRKTDGGWKLYDSVAESSETLEPGGG